METEIHMCDY